MKKIKCPFCSFETFAQKFMLKHIRDLHIQTRSCEYCIYGMYDVIDERCNYCGCDKDGKYKANR